MAERNGLSAYSQWREELEQKRKPQRYAVGAADNPALSDLQVAPGEVLMIGGAPGNGKTALVSQMVFDALVNDDSLSALIVNVEMPPSRILDRQLARLSHVSLTSIQERTVDLGQSSIISALERLQHISSRLGWAESPYSLPNIFKAVDEYQPQIVVLDYIQRIRSEMAQDSRGNIDVVMEQARELANQGAAVIGLSAISRSRDSKGRSSYDGQDNQAAFKGSSELEYGVDNGYLAQIVDDSGRFQLKHVKARYQEPRDLELLFLRRYQRFETFVEEPEGWTPP